MTTQALETFIRRHPRLLVLTGAGVSLGSGIPTYRDENGVWQRGAPMQHPDFIRLEATRRRYWIRSFAGWPLMAQAQPNLAHRALARLEQLGHVALLVTQNVDNLHQRAGSRQVVDLHGNLEWVRCLSCGQHSTRMAMQTRLLAANPWLEWLDADMRPDGDAELDETRLAQLQVPACLHCGGVLMPDVVFFGGTIPPERVAQCLTALQQADALLVVGSSLKVYSGYRFCLRAREWGKPLALVNPGWTRADELASLKVMAPCAGVLETLLSRLAAATVPG